MNPLKNSFPLSNLMRNLRKRKIINNDHPPIISNKTPLETKIKLFTLSLYLFTSLFLFIELKHQLTF